MGKVINDNNFDDHIDEEIFDCLNLDEPKSFFLFAGAGSGKTRSLVEVLKRIKKESGRRLRLKRQKVAVITYTNAACDEIKYRLDYDTTFAVSTIHSFAWELIQTFTQDISKWLESKLREEATVLEEQQSRSRDLNNKSSIDRARKIESKLKRIKNLPNIRKFTYNPNGDNVTKDSLNHSEVISIAAHFILEKPLMQDILVSKYPILLIDESQDTKKELVDAFFSLQKETSGVFSLGLFGDTMQRIYSDGKIHIEKHLPDDWVKPEKKMNHRSNKRIIRLVNEIRKSVDDKDQRPRIDKEDGHVRLFIVKRDADKDQIEREIKKEMAVITKDPLWDTEFDSTEVKALTLEHHMAARRMGFLGFFEPLHEIDRFKTSLLDGTLSGLTFFTNIILPLVLANQEKDDFALARIVKKHSPFFEKDEIAESANQIDNIKKSKKALDELLLLWNEGKDPSLIQILQQVYKTKLFQIPSSLLVIAQRTKSEKSTVTEDEKELRDDEIEAWDSALSTPFSQVEKYNNYLLEESGFGTHQGVKGLEYPRVMVIIDDEESRGFMFSYDKLFGVKELSKNDEKNIKEGNETGIDRTKRLFYVACSRAEDSLAIVAYTDSPDLLKKNVIKNEWFAEGEVIKYFG